jgi:MFS family permease
VPASAMPGAARLFLAGNAVAMTGNGLVIAFTLIYLHQARGIALPVVGLLLAAGAAAGLLAVTVCGVLLDRLGARRVLTGIILGQAAAQVLLAWAHNAATALPALLVYGATWAPMFPAIATTIAGLTPDPATQQRTFAINFTVQNAAIGAGTLAGAAVANVHHPGSFQALFLANALSCLIFAAVLRSLPARHTAPERKQQRAGYRDVLARPGLRLALVASLIVAFTAYPAFDSGLPAYATVEAHVPARIVALSLTLNTSLIVVAQLFVLRRVRRARRSSALAISGLILAIAWAVFGVAALPAAATGRIALVLGFTALFGLGETVLSPTVGPLVNRLTDDRLRGRANSLAAFSQSLAFIICPALATGLIAAGAAAVWIGLLCAGSLGTIAVGARLRRALTSDQDHVTEAPATESEPVAAARDECS